MSGCRRSRWSRSSARGVVEIATVQNAFSLAARQHADVLAHCERHGIGFIPFWPLNGGALAQSGTMADVAARHGATPAQIALAWLLARSPNILPIPGTLSLVYLETDVAAAAIELSRADRAALDALGGA
jgi:pyridoxine 4-dehydrogenase